MNINKNARTLAETLGGLRRSSIDSVATGSAFINTTTELIQDIADGFGEMPSALNRGVMLWAPIEGETQEEVFNRLVSGGYVIQVSRESYEKFLSLFDDGKDISITDDRGYDYVLKKNTTIQFGMQTFWQVNCFAKDIQSINNPAVKSAFLVAGYQAGALDGSTRFFINPILVSSRQWTPLDNSFYGYIEVLGDSNPSSWDDKALCLAQYLSTDFIYLFHGYGGSSSISKAKEFLSKYYKKNFDTLLNDMTTEEVLTSIFHDEEGQFSQDLYDLALRSARSGVNIGSAPITTLFKVLNETTTLNEINAHVATSLGCLSGVTEISSYLSSVTNPTSVIQNYVNQLRSATASPGTFIANFLNIWKGAEMSSTDSNNRLDFTDNDSIAPQLFLSGIIAASLSALATVITVILTKVAGAIGMVVGVALYAIGGALFKAFTAVDETTYAAMHPDSTVYGFNWAIQQKVTTIGAFEGEIRSLLEDYGAASIITAFSRTLIWVDEGQTVKMETHLTPLSYIDMSHICLLVSQANLLQRLNTEYVHWYLSMETTEKLYRGYQLAQELAEYEAGDDSWESYYNRSASYVDNRLKKGYYYSFVTFLLWQSLMQGRASEVKPYLGETLVGWSHANTAKAYDCAFNFFGAGWLNDVENEVPPLSWREMLVTNAVGNNYRWYVFSGILWDKVPYYPSGSGTSTLFAEFEHVVNVLDYNANLTSLPLMDVVSYFFTLPQIDRNSFILGSIVIGIVSAIVVTAATVLALKVKKSKQRSAAVHTAKAEAAWTELTNNPDDPEAYKAYRKAVRSNNLMANINGGDRLSKTNYWGDAGSVSGDSDSPSLTLDPVLANQNEIYKGVTGRSL